MKKILGIAMVAGLALAACGGSPLSIWKVSLIEGAKPATCFKDGKITDTKTDQTTIETYAGNWELYAAAKGTYQLRIGDAVVLDGAESGGVYEFSGTKTLTVVDKPDSPTVTNIATTEERIKLTMDGDAFTGTWAHTATKRCEGTCSPTFQADNPDCTVTDQIKGSKIPVQVFHQE